MTRMIAAAVAAACSLAFASPSGAATTKAELYHATATGLGGPVGRVVFRDAPGGAQILVRLYGLPPGRHGFHAHQNPSCGASAVDGAPAGAAGGHFDPGGTGKHLGPLGAGHLGDLPALTVDARGVDRETLVAPHITDVTQLKGHSVVIHAGGDTYSDQPEPLGGGGARIACGVIG